MTSTRPSNHGRAGGSRRILTEERIRHSLLKYRSSHLSFSSTASSLPCASDSCCSCICEKRAGNDIDPQLPDLPSTRKSLWPKEKPAPAGNIVVCPKMGLSQSSRKKVSKMKHLFTSHLRNVHNKSRARNLLEVNLHDFVRRPSAAATDLFRIFSQLKKVGSSTRAEGP